MREQPVGVFDSGLGGLTVVRELTRTMPGEDIIYLGDTARVPYGSKSLETVRRFSLECANFLLRFSPKLIVVACNTATAAAIEILREHCPVEVVDVIGPGASLAVERTDKSIGVIATEATIASGAYQRAIAAIDPNRKVMAQACPLLVPIVEEGRDENDPIVRAALMDYLRELQRFRPGAMILGCTHYPLLKDAIGQVMGPDVALISSAHGAAIDAQRRMGLSGLLSSRSYGGRLRCFSTDNPQRFARLGERFGARQINEVEHVSPEELESALREVLAAQSQAVEDR
ncbi:MAG: glutamate racemase [Planctomycetaceae bacterium]|nr:MAG: glutamate racemase [Planctomycetaceae bacterium]